MTKAIDAMNWASFSLYLLGLEMELAATRMRQLCEAFSEEDE